MEALAPDVEKRLKTLGTLVSSTFVEQVSDILKDSLQAVDDGIIKGLKDLFPSVEALDKYSPEEIKKIVNEEEGNYEKMRLCMHGSTALVALIDPKGKNLWVASVGDCQASEY